MTKLSSMSFEFVIDSYAWIEYFRGSDAGRNALRYIESNAAATSVLSLAELKEKYLREGLPSFDEDLAFMTARTALAQVDRQTATLAGQINYERKPKAKGWGMADSVILATARISSARVVTGDKHFEGLADAIML